MPNPTEPVLNGKHDAASTRIAELERLNDELRRELEKLQAAHLRDTALLDAYALRDLPRSEEEFLRLVQEGPSLKAFLKEQFSDSRKESQP